jgi:uncharacterized protein involved in exopolysaccharide biosynthesis
MEDSREGRTTNELASFIAAMWSRRSWVVVGALISAAAALAAVLVRTPQYEATARLAVVEFRLGELPASAQQVQTYAEIIRSQSVARDLVEQYGLDTELRMTAPDLLELVSIDLVGGTSLIELTIELPDPQLALDVTRGFADGAEILTKRINDADKERARDVLKAQFDQASAEVDRIELAVAESGGAAALTALNRELGIYLDRKQQLEQDWMELFLMLDEQKSNAIADRVAEAKAALTAVSQERRPQALTVLLEETLLQLATFRAERDTVAAELAGERARLEEADAQLATKERLLEVTRTLGPDDLLVEAQRARRSESSTPLSLTSQYINPVFENLELTVATARAGVEELAKRFESLEGLVEEYAALAETLERDLAVADSEVEERERAVELALAEYEALYAKAPAGAQSAIEVIETRLVETDLNITDVQTRYAARDARVQRLESEYQASLQVRSDLRRRLENSEVTVAGELAELMLVDPPILPETTSNTSGALLVGAVTILGALLSLLLAAIAAGVEAVPSAD